MPNPEEKAKKLKEIMDLRSEIQKTQELMQNGKEEELLEHLQKLNSKYLAETGVYNLSHPIQPKDTMENAQNCVDFLSVLLASKIADIGNKN